MKPTILIPGITGTKLADTNRLDFDIIWSGIQSKYETIYDLKLDINAQFEQSPYVNIERADVEDLAYKEAYYINKRKLEGQVFIFGYDWRRSCIENGKRLKTFVESLSAKLGEKSFNFLTHSMGGIVFACFLKNLRSDYTCIEKAIITVCPFKGAINALVGLVIGEGGIKFPFFNSNDEFRKIARTFPSVFELCPTYENAVTFDSQHPLAGQAFDITDPEHWQSNLAESEMVQARLAGLKTFLSGSQGPMNLARLAPTVRERLLLVIGVGEKTRTSVIVKKEDDLKRVKNFFDFKQNEDDGDGTVPYSSSSHYKDTVLTLSVKSKWYDKATHAFFLNDGRVQSIIRRFFAGDTDYDKWWSDIGGTVNSI